MERNPDDNSDIFPSNIDEMIAHEFKHAAKTNKDFLTEAEFLNFLENFFKNYPDQSDLHQKMVDEKYFFVALPKSEDKMNIFNFSTAFRELYILVNSKDHEGMDLDLNLDNL